MDKAFDQFIDNRRVQMFPRTLDQILMYVTLTTRHSEASMAQYAQLVIAASYKLYYLIFKGTLDMQCHLAARQGGL